MIRSKINSISNIIEIINIWDNIGISPYIVHIENIALLKFADKITTKSSNQTIKKEGQNAD